MNKKSKYKLYVVTHKKIHINTEKYESILVVGNNYGEKSFFPKGTLFDNTDKNISSANDYYSELTGLYWIWKNTNDDIVGLEHYRRFFYFPIINHFILPPSYKRVKRCLKKYDIIVPLKTTLDNKTLREIYADGAINEFKYALKKIRELYPDMHNAIEVYLNQDYLHMCNMFICKKSIIDEYCEWLFNFLFLLEKDFIKLGEDYHRPRIYGYISELFLDLWIRYKNLSIYELGRQDKRVGFFSTILNRMVKKEVIYE